MKNLIFGVIFGLLLAGCARLDTSEKEVTKVVFPEENWTRYLDTDGGVKQVAFFTAIFSKNFPARPKDGDKIGFALTQTNDGKIIKLGDIYKEKVAAFLLMDGDTNEAFDLDNEQDIFKLADAKSIKFYNFSHSGMNIAHYNAPAAVCESFENGDKISVKGAINHYADEASRERGEFLAVITQAEISLKDDDELLDFQVERHSLNFKKNLVGKKELGRAVMAQKAALRDIVCAKIKSLHD